MLLSLSSVIATACLALASTALATTYYVDSSEGDDSNAGTDASGRGAAVSPALVVLAVMLLASPMRSDQDIRGSGVWVAKVNGEPISARLLQRRIVRNRAETYRYFRQKYGVSDSAGFWTSSHGGEVPLERIKRQSLDECVRIKVEQLLARDNGVLREISYSAFLDALEKENQRRERAVAAGEPIYGPMQYREDTYFVYVLSNMLIELKRRLGRDELRAAEDGLRQHYEDIKDSKYKLDDTIRVWTIEVPFRRRPDESVGLTKDQAEARIAEARKRLDEGEKFAKLAPVYNEDGSLGERVLDEESRRFDERSRPEFRSVAADLSDGEISDVFEERNAFYILICVAREARGYMPYEDVKHNVRSDHIDREYEKLVTDLVGAATVEINREVYDEVRTR
jgi:hypothetical protein